MGFRFRKYFGVLPGIRVNVGKKRVSLSVGVRGLTANISKDGIRTTVSAPGTGLSYSSYQERTEETAPGKEHVTVSTVGNHICNPSNRWGHSEFDHHAGINS